MALRFAEELLLLIVNEDRGGLAFVSRASLDHALAGAVLMDLALERRIETDLEQLTLIEAEPTGDDLLDPALAEIAAEKDTRDAGYWVRRVAGSAQQIRDRALSRLLRAGIVAPADEATVALTARVSPSRRYPMKDGKAEQEIRLRIMRILFSDEIPDPRDVVIVALADACGIFERILSKEEFVQVRERIAVVRRLDLIGRAVAEAVRESGKEEAPAVVAGLAEIPEVRGLPVLGNAMDAAQDLVGFLERQYRELGPVFRIRLLRRRVVVIVGEEANRFMAQRARRYLRADLWRPLAENLGAKNSMLDLDGRDHVRLRRAFGPAMSRGRFEENLALSAEITRRRLAEWPESRPEEVIRRIQHIVADQMGTILAGVSATEYLDDLVYTLETLLKTEIMKQLPMWLYRRRFVRVRDRLFGLVREALESHRPGGPMHGAGDLVSDVLELHEADPQLMTEADLNIMVLSPYLAGLETVGNAAAFALYGLLKHPEALERVRAEVDGMFREDGPPTVERLRKLEYSHRAVMESLRLYPVAPVAFRSVVNTFDFAGYRIPVGTTLFIGHVVTHRLEEHFPDPGRFDPDRYLPDRAEHRQRHAYVPFGTGSHVCLGAGFAEAQLLLTLAVLLHEAEFEIVPPTYRMKITNVPTPRLVNFRVRKKPRRS